MEDERHNIEVALVDKELMHMVFGFLRFADLASVSAVCRFTPPLSNLDIFSDVSLSCQNS
jgi:hypothetical protein